MFYLYVCLCTVCFPGTRGYQGTNGCKLSGMGAGTKNQVLFFESKKCS